jgi:hypothetical protein
MVVQRDRNKHFDPKPRNVKRSPSRSDGASQVCKPGVSDGLSVDRRRQVLPISTRSNLAAQSNSTIEAPCGIHGVRHYWLCGRCSHVLTLVYEQAYGVLLKVPWPELPAEAHQELSAA